MEATSIQSSVHTGMNTIGLQGLRAASLNIDQNARRLAQGDISVKRMVSLNQQMFIYSINLHLMKISDDMIGEVIDVLA